MHQANQLKQHALGKKTEGAKAGKGKEDGGGTKPRSPRRFETLGSMKAGESAY